MSGRGYKAVFDAGRAHVRRLNADMARKQFVELCCHSYEAARVMTKTETDFLARMILELDGVEVPMIFPGDANIIDSLRRKYEARLQPQTNLP